MCSFTASGNQSGISQSVQSLSRVGLFATHGLQRARLPVHHQLPELVQIHVHWVGDAFLPSSSSVIPFSCLQSFPASVSFQLSQFFASGGQSIGVSASVSVLPMISFRMDWLDLLAVQGTLKSQLQHHSSKAPILQHSAFFTVQFSHLYMTTDKTIALTRWTFVSKVG